MEDNYDEYELLYELISAAMMLSGLDPELKSFWNLQSEIILGLFIPY